VLAQLRSAYERECCSEKKFDTNLLKDLHNSTVPEYDKKRLWGLVFSLDV
jgi:hypothetical protein